MLLLKISNKKLKYFFFFLTVMHYLMNIHAAERSDVMDVSAKQVGQNIKEIRRRHNMTQAELARRLEMRPGPVNCIENGKNFPSVKVLQRLSSILSVPIDAFFAVPEESENMCVKEEPVVYSGMVRAETPGKYIVHPETISVGPYAELVRTSPEVTELPNNIINVLGGLIGSVLALEDICTVQKSADLPLFIPFDFTVEGIANAARQARRFIGINDAVIYDYIELLENAGLRILFCKLPAGMESISCYDEQNSNAFIIVATGMNVERQLFRVMYELGRIYIYTKKKYTAMVGNEIPYTRRNKPLTDHRAARLFAALFLQPEDAVRASVAQLGIAPDEWTWVLIMRLKHRFGVSAETFTYRLAELQLMTIELENHFRDKLKAHYKETNYGEPSESRRNLNHNGRIGDLLLCAKELHRSSEVESIEETMQKVGCEIK